MYRADLPAQGTAQVWRRIARSLASHHIAPAEVVWRVVDADMAGAGDDSGDLFARTPLPLGEGPHPVRAPAPFIAEANTALCHIDPETPGLLYAALYRHQRDARAWSNPADPLTRRIAALSKAVRRDIHKMHAFVRFRESPVAQGGRRCFVAWFEPEHRIVEVATPFFAKRFADMDWLIATPFGTARHDNGVLSIGPAVSRPDLPPDASEELWGAYFANIFNPARIKLSAMRSEMPLKYWKNLPETRLIPEMLAAADARVARMRAAMPEPPPAFAERILARGAAGQPAAEASDAAPQSLDDAAQAARRCARCQLCASATQTVWGEGDADAPLMIVGEQPGDREDLQGRPFVGPAGALLRELMAEADPGPAWLTNAVKHFKFKPQGKARLHQSPNRAEIDMCRWWLDLERQFIAPKLTLSLGRSAAYALTGDDAPLAARRGRLERARDGGPVLLSWHPSFILRAPAARQAQLRRELQDDLRLAGEIIRRGGVGGHISGP